MIIRNPGRKLIAVVLLLSMAGACTACKKKAKDKRKREILESDTFFESEVGELKFPVDESKKLSYLMVDSVEYLGDMLLVNYTATYELPEEISHSNMPYIPDFDYDAFSSQKTVLFDLHGDPISKGNLHDPKDGELMTCATDKDGNLGFLIRDNNANPELSEYFILIKNNEGEVVKRISLEVPWFKDNRPISKMQFLPDGLITMTEARSGMEMPIYVFDENGKNLGTITPMGRAIMSDIFVQNGKYYILTAPSDFLYSNEISYTINEVDMQTWSLKEGKKTNGIMSTEAVSASEDGLYSTTPNGIDKYDISSGEMKEILNWNQTDVNHNVLSMVKSYPKNENEIFAIAEFFDPENTRSTYYVINLHRAEKNPHAGEKIMYVGGSYISDDFYDFVQRYNADPGNKLRIETIDYAFSETETTIEIAEKSPGGLADKVYLQFLSGNAPDILLGFSGFDQFQYGGFLEDLNPYIDGEDGLDRSLYFDNIFRAMESDGKLYSAPLCFELDGCIVAPDLVDAERNWSFEDLDKVAASLPENVELLPDMKCEEMLAKYLSPDLTDYMDMKKKNVSFSSENMIRLMEEVKKYGKTDEKIKPARWSKSIMGTSGYEGVMGLGIGSTFSIQDVGNLLACGNLAMCDVTVSDFQDYHLYKQVVPGGGKLLGYPSAQKKGILADPVKSISIVEASPYKKEAWSIIKSFFGEESQLETTAFPVSRSAFAKIGQEETDKLARVYEYFLKSRDQKDVIYYPADPNMPEELTEIVESVRFCIHRDDAVMDIIKDESAGYFLGSRTAEDVLKIVDNRARQVVQER
ncbi:MAG TPA: hypothetical protein DEO39_03365 [Clostridiales bacterium]|nr:hypothetical protein [Clostridiales bacterium]